MKHGFSLIELMIVVAIILIIATVMIPTLLHKDGTHRSVIYSNCK